MRRLLVEAAWCYRFPARRSYHLQRFRPILLATFTTVLGLLPLYLSGGEIWEGMAVSIMVGLLFGTVITLIFIPTLYSILFRVDYRGYEFDESMSNL